VTRLTELAEVAAPAEATESDFATPPDEAGSGPIELAEPDFAVPPDDAGSGPTELAEPDASEGLGGPAAPTGSDPAEPGELTGLTSPPEFARPTGSGLAEAPTSTMLAEVVVVPAASTGLARFAGLATPAKVAGRPGLPGRPLPGGFPG